MTMLSRRKVRSISGFMALVLVSHGRGDDFLGRGHADQHLANAIFPHGAHAQVARPLPDRGHAHAFIYHAAEFVIQHTNLDDAHAPPVASVPAPVTAGALAESGLFNLFWLQIEGA